MEKDTDYWKNSLLFRRREWVVVLVAMSLLGFLSLFFFPAAPDWMQRVAPNIPPEYWGRLLAIYLLGMVVTHIIIQPTVISVRHLFGVTDLEDWETPWPAALIGFCESFLYPTSFLICKPEFIAVWLALKTAGGWDVWKTKTGRKIFQVFLFGNALSIIAGLVVYGLIKAFVITKANC